MTTKTFVNLFKTKKQAALKKWETAKKENKVDLEVVELVELINGFEQYYTTSSCAGRLIIISKSSVRNKYNTTFHFKSHSPSAITIENVGFPIEFEQNELWLLLEPPNFHVGCSDLENMLKLLNLSKKAGFGQSKIQSVKPTLTIEVLGTSRISLPIGNEKKMVVSQDYLEYILKAASSMLKEEQKRLEILQDFLLNLWDNIS